MEISAKDVMELRKRTGAGMMDCKKALADTNGDFENGLTGWTLVAMPALRVLRWYGRCSWRLKMRSPATESVPIIRMRMIHTMMATMTGTILVSEAVFTKVALVVT